MNVTKGHTSRYLSVAETAKLIRAALKQKFPGVKFSVRSSSYAGGASVDVYWTDGPAAAQVDAVTGVFESRSFDGMIDMACSIYHWLLPDGSVERAYSPGTEGSRGTIEGINRIKPHDDAELVSLGSNYVMTHRRYSAATLTEIARQACEYWGFDMPDIRDSEYGASLSTPDYTVQERVYRGARKATVTDGVVTVEEWY